MIKMTKTRAAGSMALFGLLASTAAIAMASPPEAAADAAHAAAPEKAGHDAPAAAHAAPHWGYEGAEGPTHWGDLSPDYKLCAAGQMQSPVDLGVANVNAKVAVTTDYQRAPLTILNNGHTVQVNFPAGGTLISAGHRYTLLQVHFHTPSENMLNGKHYPMEAHFVHQDEAGKLAVLGVFFEEGETNTELAKITIAAPAKQAAANTIEGLSIDPRGLLPADLTVYRLMGSLTTPPCSEGVNWHVARTPVTASASQIAALTKVMGNNARPVQPLNNRLLVAAE